MCHGPQVVAMASEAHASVTCYSCHLAAGVWSLPSQKAVEILRMYPRSVFSTPGAAVVTETSRHACLACHEAVLEETVSRRGIRINHSECAKGVSCDACHSTVGHGKASRRVSEPNMDDCVACHVRSEVSVACATCHVGKVEATRRKPGVWQVTHGRNWKKMHGMGDLQSCATCHPQGYCARCHLVDVPHPADFGRTHGAASVANPTSCPTCHVQATFCDACHGMQMPHPQGFLQAHSKTAKSRQDVACKRCHSMTDCEQCHANHIHPGGTQVPSPKPSGG